jgi:hypothetical protein
MSEIIRISPHEAWGKVQKGQALLVCAYDSEEKYDRLRLEGSMSLHRFRSITDSLTHDQEIIFY